MQSFDEAIQETVRNVWTVILGMEVEEGVAARAALDKMQTERTMTACVQLTGGWEGSVLVLCTAALVREMAAVMFGTEELGGDELEDALGELVNMVGGNVKPLLPGPCDLSLPAVVEGLDYRVIVPGSRALSKILFACHGEPLVVTLLERDERSEGRSARTAPIQ